jgi:hypothetical protein
MSKWKFSEWLPKFVSNPNWRLGWFVSGFFTTLWAGLAYFIPDNYFKPTAVILMLFQNQLLYILRGGKYVVDRSLEIPDTPIVTLQPIPNGKPPAV